MSEPEATIRLHNGIEMPLYGIDTVNYSGKEAYSAVRDALENGIRHIETAADYGTEKEIGEAIRDSGVPRSSLFITDEITGINHSEATVRSAQASLRRLGIDYIDLMLLAWNGGNDEQDPANRNVYKAWKGLESIYKSGDARAIGIVDFYPWQTEYLLQDVEIAPMVSHVGLFPGHPDIAKLATNEEHRILTVSYLPASIDEVLHSRELGILAEKHECSPEDIVLAYLKQKKCAITVPHTLISPVPVLLSEEEMLFLDSMKDYTA